VKSLDLAFVHRVYKTTGWVWLVLVVLSLGFGNWLEYVIGVTIGTAISLLSLRTLELGVRWATEPGARRPRRALALLTVAKFVVIGVILYHAIRTPLVSLPGLVLGLSLVWLVIVLKILGILFSQKIGGNIEE